jgi:hypothetical protein
LKFKYIPYERGGLRAGVRWTASGKTAILGKKRGAVPTVLTAGPFKFFFYSNEGEPLKAPHIHVRGLGGEAKFSLKSPYKILDAAHFTSSNLSAIKNIIQQHNEFLLEAYNEYFS